MYQCLLKTVGHLTQNESNAERIYFECFLLYIHFLLSDHLSYMLSELMAAQERFYCSW